MADKELKLIFSFDANKAREGKRVIDDLTKSTQALVDVTNRTSSNMPHAKGGQPLAVSTAQSATKPLTDSLNVLKLIQTQQRTFLAAMSANMRKSVDDQIKDVKRLEMEAVSAIGKFKTLNDLTKPKTITPYNPGSWQTHPSSGTNIPPFPGQYNPHKNRWFLIGSVHGVCGIVAANHVQDAFDTLVDEGLAGAFLYDEDARKLFVDNPETGETIDDYGDLVSFLGNAGEPCNLTDAWCVELQWSDLPLSRALLIAQKNGERATYLESRE